ncbi:unnamed protein product [Phytophthora lilii]|uniref:Unnamed protein product n=1 Tax=Phytophthora lilii TaxID=2077276 RepID=A0A9W6XN63_9STRA|nr:unnamed protein product [Phytophthora lilii]
MLQSHAKLELQFTPSINAKSNIARPSIFSHRQQLHIPFRIHVTKRNVGDSSSRQQGIHLAHTIARIAQLIVHSTSTTPVQYLFLAHEPQAVIPRTMYAQPRQSPSKRQKLRTSKENECVRQLQDRREAANEDLSSDGVVSVNGALTDADMFSSQEEMLGTGERVSTTPNDLLHNIQENKKLNERKEVRCREALAVSLANFVFVDHG